MTHKSIKDLSVKDAPNYLFFAARNLSIELMLRTIEEYFYQRNMTVVVEWKESSFKDAAIHLALLSKDRHQRYVWLERDKIHPSHGVGSDCLYELKSITDGEYYRYKKPKVAIAFDEILRSAQFKEFITEQISRANYPFPYKSYSVF